MEEIEGVRNCSCGVGKCELLVTAHSGSYCDLSIAAPPTSLARDKMPPKVNSKEADSMGKVPGPARAEAVR